MTNWVGSPALAYARYHARGHCAPQNWSFSAYSHKLGTRVVRPYCAINVCISSEPQLCSGARLPAPPVPPEKLMYAITPAGLRAALAIDASPPIDAPASTT